MPKGVLLKQRCRGTIAKSRSNIASSASKTSILRSFYFGFPPNQCRTDDVLISSFYNKTSYSGLETHILNSYTNSLLQVLRFVRPIRKLAEGHIWTNCARENCFLCEAGFLFKMMRDAKGVNCQASNFSRAFSCNAQGMGNPSVDLRRYRLTHI